MSLPRTLIFASLLAIGQHATCSALSSGVPIKVANETETGPLSLGLGTVPVGYARITGGELPDLFVATGRHSLRPMFYLLRYQGSENDTPVFAPHTTVPFPAGGKTLADGTIWQDEQGTVYGFWIDGMKIRRTRFDPTTNTFTQDAPPLALEGLPRAPRKIAVHTNTDGSLSVLLAVYDGTDRSTPDKLHWRDKEYRPYDGGLIFRGGIGYDGLWAGTLARPDADDLEGLRALEGLDAEGLFAFTGLTAFPAPTGPAPLEGWIGGTRMGNFQYYSAGKTGEATPPRKYAVDETGIIVRHPLINASPITYPSGVNTGNLIAGGEGALYYHELTGRREQNGAPVYAAPRPVLIAGANLFPGALPVLSTGDLNGDGADDILAGNSEGKILLFTNHGTNEAPLFDAGVEIEADGEPIFIQQGYVGVQGPQEHRWGYACPRLFDWNGNGLLDIVTSSATAVHEVYPNTGTPTEPVFGKPQTLYCDGLPLHGTWRVQPAVARIGDEVLYLYLDDQDELHAAWQIDAHNLRDGGKLVFDDTDTPIKGAMIEAGGTGRIKLNLVDWDGDGKLDLLVGTPRHGLMYDSPDGPLQQRKLPGASVLFLKNLGTNEQPRFARPTFMKFRGEPITLAQHACSPAATRIGSASTDGPNLIVGDQEGLIFYYDRQDLSWD
ncbi:VCBS repeat-containing protein [Ruficoccus amylovorans]|uniref:VCBS repeat-containing protein n=1 Tax=Ruficoccus amylovorans TaxID=1804625 RepID=A0A842HI66_9BACT|nr:VCBS repeat-containing protein [Ruficoccus amylovorans]MBC2595244.1 VCBS repeat-containing protein [Ruficoccus amylovorans]